MSGKRFETNKLKPCGELIRFISFLNIRLVCFIFQEGCQWNINLNSIKELATIIVTLIPDTSPYYVTADLLFEALSSL